MSNATAHLWTSANKTATVAPTHRPRLKLIDGQPVRRLSKYAEFIARTRLSADAGHVYACATHTSTSLMPVVTMAGVRHIATRTGRWVRRTEPHWSGRDGHWLTTWISDEPPMVARSAIRIGGNEPVFAVANWSGYESDNLRTYAHIWMADLAEAKALAAAYPTAFRKVFGTTCAGEPGLGRLIFDSRAGVEIGFVGAAG